jgi:hypothetical protein
LPQATSFLDDADFGEFELAAGITQPTLVELRMHAHQRGGFGENRKFVLAPTER